MMVEESETKRGPRRRNNGFVTQDEIGAWIGKSGAWVRQIRRPAGTGSVSIPCPIPFPAPDRVIQESSREVPLWRRDRLPEFERWFRAHVRALADAEIAAMEANVRRLIDKRRSRGSLCRDQ